MRKAWRVSMIAGALICAVIWAIAACHEVAFGLGWSTTRAGLGWADAALAFGWATVAAVTEASQAYVTLRKGT